MNVSAYSSNYLVPQCSPCSLVLERGSRNSMLNLSSWEVTFTMKTVMQFTALPMPSFTGTTAYNDL